MDNVLVTGGSGFIGTRLKKIKPNWTFISSKDCDLTNAFEVRELFKKYSSLEAVVHLAGIVGGIKKNAEQQAEFFYKNVMMNTNVVHEAWNAGVPRLLASLSTCAFPDVAAHYPFKEENLFDGPPAITNFSYGYTKRALQVQIASYKKQYGVNYSTFCPSNVYGIGDTFNSYDSHFVPALILKLAIAKNGDTLEFWGTGNPLRQQLYVEDLVEIVPLLLKKHNSASPLIVAPYENLRISEMIEIALNISQKDVNIVYNNKLDGQYRKDGSNEKLINLINNYDFTKFKDGFKKTYEWYTGGQLN